MVFCFMQLNLFSQSLNDAFPQFSSELPLVSYQIGETSYTSMDSDSPIEVSFETLDYGYGLKATVTFENCSDKEVMLHNIVPSGRSDNRIYITGKGYHGLSRTHLFRPGYQPVNVTVPDNAWELGFSVLSDNSGKQYAAQTEKGKNGYGLYDLVGCVWQLTNDVYDNTTYQYIMVRGGSYFMPSSSFWYIQGGPRELNFRQYLLRVSPSFERKATVGFRCVKDAE